MYVKHYYFLVAQGISDLVDSWVNFCARGCGFDPSLGGVPNRPTVYWCSILLHVALAQKGMLGGGGDGIVTLIAADSVGNKQYDQTKESNFDDLFMIHAE